jgi:hypothetical protein
LWERYRNGEWEREREREREREKSLTGVEWEMQSTFYSTIKNDPWLIKFSFENRVYNYVIFIGSLYSTNDEDKRNNQSPNSVEH